MLKVEGRRTIPLEVIFPLTALVDAAGEAGHNQGGGGGERC